MNGIYLCRSGAWVPPWLDKDFVSMVKPFLRLPCKQIGCMPVLPVIKPEDLIRTMNWDNVAGYREAFAKVARPLQ